MPPAHGVPSPRLSASTPAATTGAGLSNPARARAAAPFPAPPKFESIVSLRRDTHAKPNEESRWAKQPHLFLAHLDRTSQGVHKALVLLIEILQAWFQWSSGIVDVLQTVEGLASNLHTLKGPALEILGNNFEKKTNSARMRLHFIETQYPGGRGTL